MKGQNGGESKAPIANKLFYEMNGQKKFNCFILLYFTFAISSGHHFSMTDGFRKLLDKIPNMVGRSYEKHNTSLP